MREDKWIQTLMEKARNEAPEYSYESAAKMFLDTLSVSFLGMAKIWLLKNVNLNGLLLTLASIGAATTLVIVFFPKTPADFPLSTIQAYTDSIPHPEPSVEIPKDNRLEGSVLMELSSSIALNNASALTLSSHMPNAADIPSDTVQTKPVLTPILARTALHLPRIDTPEPPQIKQEGDTFTLKKTDSQAHIHRLISQLQNLGIFKHFDFTQNDTVLQHFTLSLKHKQGLNLQIEGRGFDQFELKFHWDTTGSIHHFQYRFNEESYTRPIPLNCRGKKTHEYGEGFWGVRSTTNVNIAPYSRPKNSRGQHTLLYRPVLLREGGKAAFQQFMWELKQHLAAEVNGTAWYQDNQQIIQGFTLRIKNKEGMNIRIHSPGFHEFQLYWKLNNEFSLEEFKYRFDDKKLKPLPTTQIKGIPRFNVKHKSL